MEKEDNEVSGIFSLNVKVKSWLQGLLSPLVGTGSSWGGEICNRQENVHWRMWRSACEQNVTPENHSWRIPWSAREYPQAKINHHNYYLLAQPCLLEITFIYCVVLRTMRCLDYVQCYSSNHVSVLHTNVRIRVGVHGGFTRPGFREKILYFG